MPQKRRVRPEPAAVAPAAFPFRPPVWVRIWAISLGVVALAVALLVGLPYALSGDWYYLIPVVIAVGLAVLLMWRVGGLVARPTPEGTLLVRNRAKTHRLARADVKKVGTGTRANRADTPVVLITLADGTEIGVDATLSTAYQKDQLDAQVAALRAWQQG